MGGGWGWEEMVVGGGGRGGLVGTRPDTCSNKVLTSDT